MTFFEKLAVALEMLGGARPLPPELATKASVAVARGLWWVALALVVWAFSGRATKFIYIDF